MSGDWLEVADEAAQAGEWVVAFRALVVEVSRLRDLVVGAEGEVRYVAHARARARYEPPVLEVDDEVPGAGAVAGSDGHA